MAILSIVQLGDPVLRRPVRVAGRGLLAPVLQHELDHLDGHLYLDRLDSLDDLRRVEADGALVET